MTDIALAYQAAYKAGDYAAMSSYMHPDFTFTDPAFGVLSAKRSRAMFAYFCDTRDKTHLDPSVTEQPVLAEPKTAASEGGEWYRLVYTAVYTFSKTGRNVTNVITSYVHIVDGKIRRQIDEFNMTTWAKQAIGWSGVLVVNVMPSIIVGKANAGLTKWIKDKGREAEFAEE